jgi:hypothetical protein
VDMMRVFFLYLGSPPPILIPPSTPNSSLNTLSSILHNTDRVVKKNNWPTTTNRVNFRWCIGLPDPCREITGYYFQGRVCDANWILEWANPEPVYKCSRREKYIFLKEIVHRHNPEHWIIKAALQLRNDNSDNIATVILGMCS